jgi:hypothetical protein
MNSACTVHWRRISSLGIVSVNGIVEKAILLTAVLFTTRSFTSRLPAEYKIANLFYAPAFASATQPFLFKAILTFAPMSLEMLERNAPKTTPATGHATIVNGMGSF